MNDKDSPQLTDDDIVDLALGHGQKPPEGFADRILNEIRTRGIKPKGFESISTPQQPSAPKPGGYDTPEA